MKILADKRIKQFFVRAGLLTLIFTLLSAVLAGLAAGVPGAQEAAGPGEGAALWAGACCLGLGLLILMTAFLLFREENRVLEEAVAQIRAYLQGDPDARIDCEEEGELYRLFHEINSLAAILNAHAENEENKRRNLAYIHALLFKAEIIESCTYESEEAQSDARRECYMAIKKIAENGNVGCDGILAYLKYLLKYEEDDDFVLRECLDQADIFNGRRSYRDITDEYRADMHIVLGEAYAKKGDYIKAKDTTLGADNGIGVAIMLAILNSNKISHPKIEAIFTVQEETTMEGAKKIDVSMLESKKMICLDNMNEEELWIGCAGAKIFEYEIEESKQKNNIKDSILTKIEISGFRGGHSGKDISKNRGNPIKEMGNLLKILFQKYDICLKNIYGGRKVNVIPRECYSEIYIRNKDLDEIKKEIINYKKALKEKINDNENIIVDIKTINQNDDYAFDTNATKKIIKIIEEIKNGVYYKDNYDNPLVSLNIGKIENNNNKIKISFSIRSNRRKVEEKLEEELNKIIQKYKIEVKKSELEGYEHKERSMFIEKCKMIYKQYFSIKPKVIDMHICLEAGFFRRQDTRPRFYCSST